MSRLRVAFCVANPVRNLPGIVLTAFELCQRGVTCFITPFIGGSGEIFALAPNFVLLPAVAPYPFSMTLQLVAAGIQFGFAEVESPSCSSIHDLIQSAQADPELACKIACVCCSSSQTARRLTTDGLLSSDRIILTGCPRFDYYFEPLLTTYRKRTSISKNGPKAVLIDTNLAISYPRFEEVALAAVAQFHGDRYAGREESTSPPDGQTVKSLADLGRRVARDFRETDILFQSNLREVTDTLEQAFAEHPNLRLIQSGNTVSQVLQSAALVHRGCSSAFDSNLAKTPAISPQWIPSSGSDPVADDVSIKCATYDEFRQVLGSALAGTLDPPKRLENRIISTIEDTFYKIDGLAHQRAAAGILASIGTEIKPDLKKCRHYFSQLGNKNRQRTAGFPNRAGDIRELETPASVDEAGDDPFSQSAVEKLVDAISEARSAERTRPVSISLANRGGAYVSYRFCGRAIVMRCS